MWTRSVGTVRSSLFIIIEFLDGKAFRPLVSVKANFKNSDSMQSFKINSDRQDLTFRFKKGRNSKSILNLETEYFGLKDLSGFAIYESIRCDSVQYHTIYRTR